MRSSRAGRFGLRIEFSESLQFVFVHQQAQIGELGFCCDASLARFQALRGAVEAFPQRAVFVGVTEFTQQPPDFVGSSPGLSHQPERGGKRDPPRFGVLQHAALEHPALPRAVRVKTARAIRAEGGARLRKARDRLLPPRNFNRQPERFQFQGIVNGLQFDPVKQRAVAA